VSQGDVRVEPRRVHINATTSHDHPGLQSEFALGYLGVTENRRDQPTGAKCVSGWTNDDAHGIAGA
jgi:hypothetical protein